MKFKCILQTDETDCGPACLAAIFRKYGLNVSIAKLREIAGTDRLGTSVYGLVKTLDYYKFQSMVVEGTRGVLDQKLPLPAIAHVIVNNSLHYVVIAKITNNAVVISDPAKGIVKYEKSKFLEIWTRVLIFIMPTKETVRGNERKTTLLSFIKLIGSQKCLIIKIFFLSLVLSLIGILTSFYYKIVMDSVLPSQSKYMLSIASLITIGLFVVQMVVNFFRGVLVVKLEQKIDIPIMLGYYNHTLVLPMSFYSLRDTGEIISRFEDASNIRNLVSEASVTIMMDLLMAIVGGIVLFVYNKVLFAVSVMILIAYAFIVFIYNKPMKRLSRETMEMNSKVTSRFVETINGIETIKAFNKEKHEKERTSNLYNKFLKKVFKNGVLALSQQTLTALIAVIGELVILWIGSIYVLDGTLNIGELMSFNALLIYFVDPVKNLLGLHPKIQAAVVAADRLGELLDISPEKEELSLDRKKFDFNRISISNLNFRYGTGKLVLKNINLDIECGKKIAFVGESGSGKTTLSKLLVKMYEKEGGNIKFGDNDIKSLSISQIRDSIAYISQNTFLFTGTIKDNLLIGNPNATDEELSNICDICKLDSFIDSLPLKLNTLVEENGKNFSGGQKQRLAIARALLSKPKVLIMDEATSHLDSITEKAIEKAINTFNGKMTIIIIAHRLNTVKDCDKIYVFSNGEIVESGNHNELLRMDGAYSRLWHIQEGSN